MQRIKLVITKLGALCLLLFSVYCLSEKQDAVSYQFFWGSTIINLMLIPKGLDRVGMTKNQLKE